jgi:hypothetical protein
VAGALFGTAIAIKLFPAVVVGWFLLKRQWSVVVWSAFMAVTLTAAAAAVLGPDATHAYITAGLPDSTNNRTNDGNYSLHAAGWHIFAGTPDMMPLVPAAGPGWALPILMSLFILGAAAGAIRKSHDPDAEFALALCAMALAIPITLQYYLVMLLWPMFVLGSRLRARAWPRYETNLLVGAILAMQIPLEVVGYAVVSIGRAVEALADGAAGSGVGQVLPAAAGLPLFVLPLGPGLLFWGLTRELAQGWNTTPTRGPHAVAPSRA